METETLGQETGSVIVGNNSAEDQNKDVSNFSVGVSLRLAAGTLQLDSFSTPGSRYLSGFCMLAGVS